MPFLQRLANGDLLVAIHVQPRASHNQVVGLHADSLKVRLTTPPVDGKANQALLAYLAKLLHLPKSALILQSGQQSREKKVVIHGCPEEAIRKILGGGG